MSNFPRNKMTDHVSQIKKKISVFAPLCLKILDSQTAMEGLNGQLEHNTQFIKLDSLLENRINTYFVIE